MTRNDDFDQTLAAWLRREAPPQAPDRVLDAALQRVALQSQKRSWLQRLIGETQMTILTRTAAVVAMVALAAIIGFQFNNLIGNIGDSPSPTPSTSPGASSPSPTPNAQPSDAALVLRLLAGGEGGRVHAVTVWGDGRVFTTADPGSVNPPAERRLTTAGIQLLRDEMDATGLTDTSADYLPVANPGVEPPGYGGAGPSLEVGQPRGGTVVVTWFLLGDTEQDYWQPQPEAEALEVLAGRLSTMDEWLPASAWADEDPSLPAGCPTPDVEALSEFVWPTTDVVACYRDTPLTFDAEPVAGVADCPVTVEPVWLSCPQTFLRLVGETRKVGAPSLTVAIDPVSALSLPLNTDVRITGHFEDPAAQTCNETERPPLVGGTPEPAADTIERCRRTFVVTGVAPLD